MLTVRSCLLLDFFRFWIRLPITTVFYYCYIFVINLDIFLPRIVNAWFQNDFPNKLWLYANTKWISVNPLWISEDITVHLGTWCSDLKLPCVGCLWKEGEGGVVCSRWSRSGGLFLVKWCKEHKLLWQITTTTVVPTSTWSRWRKCCAR